MATDLRARLKDLDKPKVVSQMQPVFCRDCLVQSSSEQGTENTPPQCDPKGDCVGEGTVLPARNEHLLGTKEVSVAARLFRDWRTAREGTTRSMASVIGVPWDRLEFPIVFGPVCDQLQASAGTRRGIPTERGGKQEDEEKEEEEKELRRRSCIFDRKHMSARPFARADARNIGKNSGKGPGIVPTHLFLLNNVLDMSKFCNVFVKCLE